jgi:outer membrane protein OmpA-like peptidoglycan-associated protein
MAEITRTAAQLVGGVRLSAGASHVITLARPAVRVRLVGMFFELNKCFLLPSVTRHIRTVTSTYDEHPGSNLLIVGHTDTSGKADYNLTLSLERADAVAAYLTDDVDAWLAFFDNDKPDEKRWSTRENQHMLSVLPEGAATDEVFFSGAPDGAMNERTRAAIRKFQHSEGLAEDGIAGPLTRRALVKRYMSIDATTLPGGIQITTHGCGESFPVASTADQQRSPDDRRVELFFFDGPILPAPPGNTSGPGSPQYGLWIAQVQETIDLSSTAVGGGVFVYALPLASDSPWTSQAVLRITAVDGSDERRFTMSQGQQSGNYRVFEFPDSIAGLEYRGFVEQGSSSIQVFGAVELRRLADPDGGADHLPLPERDPLPDELPAIDSPPPTPSVPPDPDFSAEAIAVAAAPSALAPPIALA